MTEARDPAIKLFGQTIPLPESQPPAEDGLPPGKAPMLEPAGDEKDICKEVRKTEVEDSTPVPGETEKDKPNCSSCLDKDNEDNHQTSSQHDKATVGTMPEQDQTEADASDQEKILKKPDKVIPCPRCNSLDTKFCYYNNYNVNQPRHFCKNCQRYWTAGGTMRNVPVGAGRRKNKHSTSHYRHIMMPSDGLASPRIDATDSIQHPALSCGPSTTEPLKSNGTILKFGPEAPLCESMASVLSVQEQKRNTELGSMVCRENKEEPSCAPSATASNCAGNGFTENAVHDKQNNVQGYCNGVTPVNHLQCYPGPPWAYPWSPGWNNLASAMAAGRSSELSYGLENVGPTPVPWSGQSMMAAPAFCAPNIPFAFMPATFWGCMSSGWTKEAWNVPWLGTNGILSPTSSTSNSGCSGNGSPTLGKHSRDASSQVEEKTEKSLWVPKTLRIDDPDEAAKSSIWATLGIKPDEGCIFKAFRSKEENEVQTSDAPQALHANPAALSRSRSFQERT